MADDDKFNFAAVETANGHIMGECISALQKTIRRGQAAQAYYWALEIAEEGYTKKVFSRLAVIAAEDCAPEEAVSRIWTYYSVCKEFSKSMKNFEKMYLAQAVYYLAGCPKSREVDAFKNFVEYKRSRKNLLEMPDYALDCHTKAGIKQKRGWKHFCRENARVNNKIGDDQWEKKMCSACPINENVKQRTCPVTKEYCDGSPIRERLEEENAEANRA